ncbi:hypothetical protein HDU93_007869, partial [Gonapodya sp. JEL0774]
MPNVKDAELISAVEASSLILVRKALAEGADPNARKSVTLTRKLKDSEGTKTETILAESAIAIAVIRASPEIVTVLVQAGADS